MLDIDCQSIWRKGDSMHEPLESIRIVELGHVIAGPLSATLLSDFGAEVIKIENPNDGGDMARGVGPHFFAPGDSQFFHSFNRNKKSLTK